MTQDPRIAELADRLGDIPLVTEPRPVRAKSRDFFWYSPPLKARLDHVTADAVVAPRNEDEVLRVLAAAHALDLPVTPRGGGTGNYGQAMPLAGGLVLDMGRMNQITELSDGQLTCQPGALMGRIDAEARAALGQELRLHPSTRETASIGGFIAGGSGGVGSIRWGMLAEPGNILSVQLATAEREPRVIDLAGAGLDAVRHAYGVTGVITSVTMPLAPAPDWVDMLIAFADFPAALAAGWQIGAAEGLWLKQLAAIEAPAPKDFFGRHAAFLEPGEHVLCLMVAPNSADVLADLAGAAGGRIAYRSDRAAPEEARVLPHIYHLCWNHTTLRALRHDPAWTYLQIGLPEGAELDTAATLSSRFPDEVITHVEYTRWAGRLRLSALPLVRFSTEDRLNTLMASLEEMGCPVWNPHVYTLEEGNRRGADPVQLDIKRAHDPKGLLNPGKMIAWEDPAYAYDATRRYDYPQLQPKE